MHLLPHASWPPARSALVSSPRLAFRHLLATAVDKNSDIPFPSHPAIAMSFSRSTVTRIAFPSPHTITPGPGSYDVRLPRAFTDKEDSHHTPTHPTTAHSQTSTALFHSPAPSTRARRMSSPCSAADVQSHLAAATAALSSAVECTTPTAESTTTPLAASPRSSSSPSHSPFAPPVLTSSAQKRRLARQAQRGVTLQPLTHIVTSPELLRDKPREQHSQHTQAQPPHVSPTATTASTDESANSAQPVKAAVTATPMQVQTSAAVAPSSCRRFRFADANEGAGGGVSAFSSPSHNQPPHPITALSHASSPAAAVTGTGSADVVDARIQRLEERCRELEEAKRRSHAAWMEELSSQALIKQQLTAQRHTIEQLEQHTAALTQQRDTHATRVQQLTAELTATHTTQRDHTGKLSLLQDQHTWLDEVSEQQSAAIAALRADVAAKEQQLAAVQSCLEAERRRYEELRSGVDGSIVSGQQLRAVLEATQAELRAVLADKEQLIHCMDALERQVDEAAAREQSRTKLEREANKRSQAAHRQLEAQLEESDSERQQLLQQTRQLRADVVHWQHKYQAEADSRTALQHQQSLTHTKASTTAPHVSSPTSAASSSHGSGEQKEERVSRLAAVRRQLTEMRDSIAQRLAAIRPVKRKDDKLLALQAELERSEAEMERLLKEHEATWQQVTRVRRDRCLSCGGFHLANSSQSEVSQQSSEAFDVKDALMSEMSAFNRRLQADNAALRQQVEALMKERDEALTQTRQSSSSESSANKSSDSGKRSGKREKRLRDGGDKENEVVLQPLDVNGGSVDRKQRRSLTAGGGSNKRQSVGTPVAAVH